MTRSGVIVGLSLCLFSNLAMAKNGMGMGGVDLRQGEDVTSDASRGDVTMTRELEANCAAEWSGEDYEDCVQAGQAAAPLVNGAVARMSAIAGASFAPGLSPVTQKPRPTQVEPEVLAGLRSAQAKAWVKRRALDEKAATLAENLGYPDTDPNGTVAGRVADARGRPLSGASVVLMDTNGDLMAQGHTDAGGEYLVTSLQSGPYVVQVLPSAKDATKWARTWYPAAPSFPRAEVLTVDDAGATADVTVQPGALLDVIVAAQGKPLVGATVQVCGESYLDCQAATSDAKGKVALAGIPVTPLRVAVTTTGGMRYEFVSAIKSAGANKIRLDTVNSKLVARGK